MLNDFKRFDMKRTVSRQHLVPILWGLCFPQIIKHKNHLKKINMEGIKPPYILLCNHNAFMDFKVAEKAIFPHAANYVVAIDGFLKREWLLRLIGCICKRKFTSDTTLIHQLKTVIDRKNIAVIYPEARYSLCGTTALMPESLGKLCKLFKVPVVTLICHGHHVNSPFWNLTDRGVLNTEAEMTCLFNKEQIKTASHEEIFAAIQKAFEYDDFKWQKEKNLHITYNKRAEGLHKVLYQCASCKTEYEMETCGTTLRCKCCGKEWEMTELGELKAKSGQTEFSHIPDWYEWERKNVRAEIDAGTYSFECQAHVDDLPKDKFVHLGKATLTHNMNGFTLCGNYNGEEYNVHWDPKSLYSCHIEYEYLGKYGDCVDLNTLQDTFYIYPENCKFAVTKMALATEELWKKSWGK